MSRLCAKALRICRVAKPQQLSRPPIFEALVDIRADAPNVMDVSDRLAEALKDEFPKNTVSREMRAEIKVHEGRLLPPLTRDLGPHGLQLSNADGSLAVQFRRDGFTLNNLRTYIGGERLMARALALWELFTKETEVGAPSRLAMRYINKLELPLASGDDFDKFLTASPELPPEVPDNYSEFLSRVVAHTGVPGSPFIIVTQSLTHEQGRPVILIDLDAFKAGAFSADPSELLAIFRGLKELQKSAFFSLLTEETVKLFL